MVDRTGQPTRLRTFLSQLGSALPGLASSLLGCKAEHLTPNVGFFVWTLDVGVAAEPHFLLLLFSLQTGS